MLSARVPRCSPCVYGLVLMCVRSLVSHAYYEHLVRSSLEEMHSEYLYAMKKSMVDYVCRWGGGRGRT